MSAVVDLPRSAAPARSIGFGNVMRSEWTKLRSLRSTQWSAGIVVLLMLGLAVGLGLRWAHVLADHPNERAGFDSVNTVVGGTYLAQVVVGALGVLVMTSEYASGMIRATFAAVPQRRIVLAGKIVVLSVATFVLAECLAFASFGVGEAMLATKGYGIGLGHPGALRAVVGVGLYLAAVALLGFGLGAVIRNTAGALSALFVILFAFTILAQFLPQSLQEHVNRYLPGNAGPQILTTQPVHGALSPWAGLGVFCCYALVVVVAGVLLVEPRDA